MTTYVTPARPTKMDIKSSGTLLGRARRDRFGVSSSSHLNPDDLKASSPYDSSYSKSSQTAGYPSNTHNDDRDIYVLSENSLGTVHPEETIGRNQYNDDFYTGEMLELEDGADLPVENQEWYTSDHTEYRDHHPADAISNQNYMKDSHDTDKSTSLSPLREKPRPLFAGFNRRPVGGATPFKRDGIDRDDDAAIPVVKAMADGTSAEREDVGPVENITEIEDTALIESSEMVEGRRPKYAGLPRSAGPEDESHKAKKRVDRGSTDFYQDNSDHEWMHGTTRQEDRAPGITEQYGRPPRYVKPPPSNLRKSVTAECLYSPDRTETTDVQAHPSDSSAAQPIDQYQPTKGLIGMSADEEPKAPRTRYKSDALNVRPTSRTSSRYSPSAASDMPGLAVQKNTESDLALGRHSLPQAVAPEARSRRSRPVKRYTSMTSQGHREKNLLSDDMHDTDLDQLGPRPKDTENTTQGYSVGELEHLYQYEHPQAITTRAGSAEEGGRVKMTARGGLHELPSKSIVLPPFIIPAAFLNHIHLIKTVKKEAIWQSSLNNAQSLTSSTDWHHIDRMMHNQAGAIGSVLERFNELNKEFLDLEETKENAMKRKMDETGYYEEAGVELSVGCRELQEATRKPQLSDSSKRMRASSRFSREPTALGDRR